MSASMANILKLLTLCALAHSITGVALPAANPPQTILTMIADASPPAALLAPPPTLTPQLSHLSETQKYLIVRGEHSTPDGLDEHHEVFNAAAAALLDNSKAARGKGKGKGGEQLEEVGEMEACDAPSHRATFSGYDYVILIAMLVISLGIGVFYGFFHGSGSSSAEFLLGSGMTVFPVTLSLMTSFITAIELLGNPSEMYYHGTQFVWIVVPMILVIPVAVKIFYPIYYRMELTSCYEYLGIRFGKEIRVLGALLYVIQMCFYTSVAVLAPAIALSKATGLNTTIAVVLIYIVCVFYSSQGGMKAVVIADTFQAAVLAVSLILIVALGCFYSGTPMEVFQTASERGRLEFFNIDVDPTTRHTVWSVMIGGFFYWTALFCTNQASVQKCMSLKSLKLAKIALGFAIFGLVVVFIMNFYTGLMVFNHYADCDPLLAGRITASDQLLPYYVISTYEQLKTVAGIFVAGIFAASLGTVASALNSLSAVTMEDLLMNGMNIKISPEKGAMYAKWMSLGFGIFSFGLVFIVEKLGGVLQATLTLNGLIGGVTLGLFILGMTFKQANTKGAFYGGILSLMIVIFIGVVAQVANVEPDSLPVSVEKCDCALNVTLVAPEVLVVPSQGGFFAWSIFKISYMWYSMIGAVLTILLGLAISAVLNAVLEHKVLQITSASVEAAHNGQHNNSTTNNGIHNGNVNIISHNNDMKMHVSTVHVGGPWQHGRDSSFAAAAAPKPAHELGHVNHAVRLDDE